MEKMGSNQHHSESCNKPGGWSGTSGTQGGSGSGDSAGRTGSSSGSSSLQDKVSAQVSSILKGK